MNQFSTVISLRIMFIFGVGILMSFLPEAYPNFFGDEHCDFINLTHNGGYWKVPHTHWGYRHWMYFAMGLCLFIAQAVFLIKYIDKNNK